MKDLRVVIVSWNVEDLLERCLKSLPDACGGLDWECVVVDNASADASVDIAQKISAEKPLIWVIANTQNLGFSKACNIGAKDADARYVLFLNPDTDCPTSSLEKLVHEADQHPKAGIVGPKLLYPDGSPQPSVRRFPGVWDQLLIALKISHLFPNLSPLRRYFAKDLDANKEQSVDQVMGACFLVRKELLDQKLGFDERYFVWMEEVDFCKTAKKNGWEVLYVPSVSVTHHLGQSFAKEFHLKRQQMFARSLTSYFKKWHAGWQAGAIQIAAAIGVAIVWLASQLAKPAVAWSVIVVALETISALTIFQPIPNSVVTFTIGVTVLLLAWKKPTFAIGLMLSELLIGSKGQLLQFGYWPFTTSLRIVMVGAFLAGWSMDVLQKRRWRDVFRLARGRMQYAVLYLLIGYAFLVGIDLKNGASVIADGNAWLDWILLFPVLDVVTRHAAQVKKWLTPVFFVGIFWLAIKTLGLEYLFSHGFKSISPDAYLWVRRTGVGEVTLVIANAFRIFMQSYVYATAALLMSLAWLLFQKASGISASVQEGLRNIPWPSGRERVRRPSWAEVLATPVAISWFVICASVFILGISLSRSFWVGTAAGGFVLLVLLSTHHVAWWKNLLKPIVAALVGLFLIFAALAFPIPRVDTASLAALFGSRTNISEAAAVSRWNLMPVLWQKIMQHPILGSGFGATVTYQSEDPRIVAQTGTGEYTTYAFEWGWLEHWIKFGILGIPVMLWLLISLGWRVWSGEKLEARGRGVRVFPARTVEHVLNVNPQRKNANTPTEHPALPLWFRSGFVASLIALAVLHFFTPYLNHPLGFLYFFVGEAVLVIAKTNQDRSAPRK